MRYSQKMRYSRTLILNEAHCVWTALLYGSFLVKIIIYISKREIDKITHINYNITQPHLSNCFGKLSLLLTLSHLSYSAPSL